MLGNVKFDLAVPGAMLERGREFRERIGARRVWLAASTREGEEALILDAFAASGAAPEVLLAIVPRHPQRFDEVARLAAARSLSLARRSGEGPVPRYYHYIARTKDVVNRGGMKISPAELETLIDGHPKVREAAVIGVPHARLGETVCAVAVLRDPAEKLELE